MAKQVVQRYIFDPIAGTVTLPDYEQIDLGRLALITNVTRNVILFNLVNPSLSATVSGNVITLATSTVGMSASDAIRIDYNVPYGEKMYDREIVGNARSKFRDGFTGPIGSAFVPGTTWTVSNTHPSDHLLVYGGDSSGSSYLDISLSPLVEGSVTLTSNEYYSFPIRVGFGLSLSQRLATQQTYSGIVGCDPDGVVDTSSPIADKAITGATISISSNVGTVTLTNHGYQGGDRVAIVGCPEARLNVAPVVITVVDRNTFTVPITLANGTYSSVGGVVRWLDPTQYASNSAGYLTENATATNASFIVRRENEKFRTTGASTIATTTPTQSNTSPYTDAWNATSALEIFAQLEEVNFRSYPVEGSSGSGAVSGYFKYHQGLPVETKNYKIRFHAENLPAQSKPIGRVTAISKSGTTTATVTTDVPHGLTTANFVLIYGVRDQTNFANLTTATQISSVVSPTQFTVILGSAVTASSAGGFVILRQGANDTIGQQTTVVSSLSRTNNVMTVIGQANWANFAPGDYIQLHGMDAASFAYDGAYRVLRLSTTTLEVESVGPDFVSVNSGGGVIRRTDVRLHFTRLLDYTRHAVEVYGGKGNTTDANNAVPVTVSTGNVSASISTASSITIFNRNSSSAITGTETQAPFGPSTWNINDSRQVQRDAMTAAAERVKTGRWTY